MLIHNFKNARRDGKVFGLDLVDKVNTLIHVTCFNDVVEQFHNLIQLGIIYVISNGQVNVANTKYNSSTNPFEVVLHNSSTIALSKSVESTIPMHSFNIKSIESLQCLPINHVIDICNKLIFLTEKIELYSELRTDMKTIHQPIYGKV